jgi:hypothetical protein
MSKGRTPPPRQTLADRAVVAEAVQAVLRRPGLWMQQFYHDDWCQTLKNGRAGDCNCEPNVRLVHYDDLQKERQ